METPKAADGSEICPPPGPLPQGGTTGSPQRLIPSRTVREERQQSTRTEQRHTTRREQDMSERHQHVAVNDQLLDEIVEARVAARTRPSIFKTLLKCLGIAALILLCFWGWSWFKPIAEKKGWIPATTQPVVQSPQQPTTSATTQPDKKTDAFDSLLDAAVYRSRILSEAATRPTSRPASLQKMPTYLTPIELHPGHRLRISERGMNETSWFKNPEYIVAQGFEDKIEVLDTEDYIVLPSNSDVVYAGDLPVVDQTTKEAKIRSLVVLSKPGFETMFKVKSEGIFTKTENFVYNDAFTPPQTKLIEKIKAEIRADLTQVNHTFFVGGPGKRVRAFRAKVERVDPNTKQIVPGYAEYRTFGPMIAIYCCPREEHASDFNEGWTAAMERELKR
jgi:hypothetical protein